MLQLPPVPPGSTLHWAFVLPFAGAPTTVHLPPWPPPFELLTEQKSFALDERTEQVELVCPSAEQTAVWFPPFSPML
jgi:hypothetical protein